MPSDSSVPSLIRAEFPPSLEAKRLPIALIGASGYGTYHLNILRAFQDSGLVELVAVADPAISRLPDLRANLERQHISCYENSEELFRRERNLKAVGIAAPIPWHEELCRAALGQNFFIYLEKPPVPLIQQWDSLMRLDSSRKIAIAFQNIASSPVQTLKRWLVESRLGKIETIRIAGGWPRDTAYYGRNNWAGKLLLGDMPVFDGPATNGLAHVLHDAMFLASPEPSGFAVPMEVKAELYRARPIESYDTCSLQAVLEGGITLTAALTHACEKLFPYQIVVTGSKGKAWINGDGTALENDQGWAQVRESIEPFRSRCYENFVRYALGHRARPDTFLADTRGYVLLTNGMLLSSGTIHPIATPHASVVGTGQEETYAIQGIHSLLQSTLETGLLFSEQGVTWAVKGQPQSVRELLNCPFHPTSPCNAYPS